MLLIYPKKHTHTMEQEAAPVEAVTKDTTRDKPADWPYMEMSGQILRTPPDTWKAYPATLDGARAIIDMEYRELLAALNAGKPTAEIMRELVHLGTATLHMWRMYHAG